jgi:hypothetical protein
MPLLAPGAEAGVHMRGMAREGGLREVFHHAGRELGMNTSPPSICHQADSISRTAWPIVIWRPAYYLGTRDFYGAAPPLPTPKPPNGY